MTVQTGTPGVPRPGHGLLRVYSTIVAWLCRAALALAALLLITDLVLIGVGVVLRYVFSRALPGGDEIVAGTLTALVMLAAPEVLRRGEHIGVDVLTNALRPRPARWAGMWANFTVLVVALLLVVNGWQAMALSRMIGALTQGNLELPIWVLQLFLPLGGTLLALVALERLWRQLAGLAVPGSEAAHGAGGKGA